ncbi:hypothetical protein ACIP5Y_06985 [Nocardia sp. NPDC088792]|uniref:hypothetical protein n=1 Tax=Nocardia sp. NPDC088792 TaxID=3364332 RepID=UPI0037F68A59
MTGRERLVSGKVAELKTKTPIFTESQLEANFNKEWFFVPYEKTRNYLNENWGSAALSAPLWITGIVEAFNSDATALQKTAAVAAVIPVVGNLLGLGTSWESSDLAGVLINSGFLVIEVGSIGAEIGGYATLAAALGPIGTLAALAAGFYVVAKSMLDESAAVRAQENDLIPNRDMTWNAFVKDLLNPASEHSQWLYDSTTAWAASYYELLAGQALQITTTILTAEHAHGNTATSLRQALVTHQKEWQPLGKAADEFIATIALNVRTEFIKQIKESMHGLWNSPVAAAFKAALNTRVDAIAREKFKYDAFGLDPGMRANLLQQAQDWSAKKKREVDAAPPLTELDDNHLNNLLNTLEWPKGNDHYFEKSLDLPSTKIQINTHGTEGVTLSVSPGVNTRVLDIKTKKEGSIEPYVELLSTNKDYEVDGTAIEVKPSKESDDALKIRLGGDYTVRGTDKHSRKPNYIISASGRPGFAINPKRWDEEQISKRAPQTLKSDSLTVDVNPPAVTVNISVTLNQAELANLFCMNPFENLADDLTVSLPSPSYDLNTVRGDRSSQVIGWGAPYGSTQRYTICWVPGYFSSGELAQLAEIIEPHSGTFKIILSVQVSKDGQTLTLNATVPSGSDENYKVEFKSANAYAILSSKNRAIDVNFYPSSMPTTENVSLEFGKV